MHVIKLVAIGEEAEEFYVVAEKIVAFYADPQGNGSRVILDVMRHDAPMSVLVQDTPKQLDALLSRIWNTRVSG